VFQMQLAKRNAFRFVAVADVVQQQKVFHGCRRAY
jgi:hypothetical protein